MGNKKRNIFTKRTLRKLRGNEKRPPTNEYDKVTTVPRAVEIDEKGNGVATFTDIPEDIDKARVVVGYLIKENTKKMEEQQKIKETSSEKSDPDTSKTDNMPNRDDNGDDESRIFPIPIILIVGAALTSLTLGFGGCVAEECKDGNIFECEITKIEEVRTPIDDTIYHVDTPNGPVSFVVNANNQERAINEDISGNDDFYIDEDAADREQSTIEGSQEWRDNEEELMEAAESLQADPTKDTKQNLEKIVEAVEEQKESYDSKEPVLEQNADEFIEQADVFPDERTEGEIKNVEEVRQEFKDNDELTETNVDTASKLKSKSDDVRYDVSIKVDKDKDIEITGEKIESIVKKEKLTGIRALIQNIKEFFIRRKSENIQIKEVQTHETNTNNENIER